MRILFLNQSPRTPPGKPAPYDKEQVEDLLNSYASPGTSVEIGFPDDFDGSKVLEVIGEQKVLNGLHHAMEVPAIVRKIAWAIQNGYDAVIQSNTFDPGVEQGRLIVRIPVIGLFKTSLHMGLTLADRIGITVPLPSHVPYTWRILRAYEMDKYVTSIKSIGIYGTDIQTHKKEISKRMIELIEESIGCGAEIILPLGGALIPYVVDPMDLQEATGIQVLNTKAIGIRHAETCVNIGLVHSTYTYPLASLSGMDLVSRS